MTDTKISRTSTKTSIIFYLWNQTKGILVLI